MRWSAEQLRHGRHRGFTLLELVLVLVIAATALAMAAPSLRGWRRGAALRSSMDQVQMLTRLARSEAIAKGKVHRLEFSENMEFQLKMLDRHAVVQGGTGQGLTPMGVQRLDGSFTQPDSAGFVPIQGEFGKVYKLPEGSKLEVAKAQVLNEYQQADQRVIDFYPSGRTQAATISVTDADGFQVVLQCTTPAGSFKWLAEGLKN